MHSMDLVLSRKGKLGAMFELSSEPVGPSFCDASTETKRRARSGLEAEACNSIPLEDVRLTPLESGPTDRAGHKLQIRGVTFLTLSECKLAGGRSYRRVQRRDERGLTGTVSSNVSRLPENPVSLRSRPRSAARLRSQALAAASLSQSLNQTPAFEEPSIHSASNLQPALEANVQKKRRSAGFFSQEQGANLLQNLAKVSIPWLRYTRFSVAQTRAIMRNIPLLERAGLGALAGGLAGGFTNATLHPLDTVKTKLQTKGGTALYTGAWDVVRKVLAKQGIRGFYRGLPAAVVGSIPSSAIYFGTYELGKELLLRLPPFANTRLAVPPFAAAVGNIASSAILVPKELVKQRLQAGVAGTAGGVLASIVREEGVKGLYRGYSAALLRNVPSNVISFSTFEYLKAGWLAGSGDAELQPWQSLLSGAVAGMLSAAATTPLDVVKTRLMTEARRAVSQTGATGKVAEAVAKAQFVSAFTPSGVVSTLRQISAEEGFKGLVRGAGPRIVYGGCFSAMGFLSFETAKHILLERYLRKKEREGLEQGEQIRMDDSTETSGQLPLEATTGKTSASQQNMLIRDRIGATKKELQAAPSLERPLLTHPNRSRDRR